MSDDLPIPALCDIPRRCFLEKLTATERSAHNTISLIEGAGAHPLLTTAQVLIIDAKRALSDWVDAGCPGASGWAQTVPVGETFCGHKFNDGRRGYGQSCVHCGRIASYPADEADCPRNPNTLAKLRWVPA